MYEVFYISHVPKLIQTRYCLRRVAARVLSAPSPMISASRSRRISIFAPSIPRKPQIGYTSVFQRRFASNEVKESENIPTHGGQTPVAPEATSAEQLDISDIQHNKPEHASAPQAQEHPSNESNPHSASQGGTEAQPLAQEIFHRASNTAQSTSEAVAGAASTISDKAGSMMGTRGAQASNTSPKTTLYAGNLFFDVKEEDLKTAFSKFGPVEKVKIIYDGRGLSKGYWGCDQSAR